MKCQLFIKLLAKLSLTKHSILVIVKRGKLTMEECLSIAAMETTQKYQPLDGIAAGVIYTRQCT